MSDAIFFHEDFYRQIELVPNANYFKIISTFKEDSIEPIEFGFPLMHERDEHLRKTEDLNIQIESIYEKLQPYALKTFKIVETGYSNTRNEKKNVISLGFERLALFFELYNENLVQHIWLWQSHLLPNLKTYKNILNALVLLGTEYQLILVDWNEGVVLRLASSKAVESYLTEYFGFHQFDQ